MDKEDIYFILESYILECVHEFMPSDINPNSKFSDKKLMPIKSEVIKGIMEIFEIQEGTYNIEEIDSLQQAVDFIYMDQR